MSKSKADIFYPFYVGDYRKDTARLSCEQHGAYRLLIDEYWVAGPLPDDDEVLARIVGLEVRRWRSHRSVVLAFFKLKGGLWRHKRIDAELSKARTRSAKAKAGAEARWGSPDAPGNPPSNARSNARGDANHSHSHIHSPSQPSQEVGRDSQEGSGGEVIPLAGRGAA